MKVKNILWAILGFYFLIMAILMIQWFGVSLIFPIIILFIVGLYCVFKSNVIPIIWDRLFPDAEEWDKDEDL